MDADDCADVTPKLQLQIRTAVTAESAEIGRDAT